MLSAETYQPGPSVVPLRRRVQVHNNNNLLFYAQSSDAIRKPTTRRDRRSLRRILYTAAEKTRLPFLFLRRIRPRVLGNRAIDERVSSDALAAIH